MALSNRERNRRYRLRKKGVPVPRGRPGRKPKDYFDENARTPEAIVARLLRDAKLENWDGVIAASEGESEARQVMQKLLAMVRGAE